MARTLHQPVFGTDWRGIPLSEWDMLRVALAVVVECDNEKLKELPGAK